MDSIDLAIFKALRDMPRPRDWAQARAIALIQKTARKRLRRQPNKRRSN